MSYIQILILQVKQTAERELEYCDAIDTPYVCQMIQEPAGKKKVINQIVELVGKRGISVSAAILEIENNANPQHQD